VFEIRPIGPSDKERLAEGLRRLSRETIRKALATALADAAVAVGIRRFAATMLADNEPARRLMRTFARRLEERRAPGGTRQILLELAA